MDPNTVLENLLTAVGELRRIAETLKSDDGALDEFVDLAQDVAQDVENLDWWLVTGGYMPRRWRPWARTTSRNN